jgi:hypothetical protein
LSVSSTTLFMFVFYRLFLGQVVGATSGLCRKITSLLCSNRRCGKQEFCFKDIHIV